MKKYFVCYFEWNNLYGAWNPNNIIIEQHPLDWLKEKYPNKALSDVPIKLGFWEEIK